jgi:hypothetical protein
MNKKTLILVGVLIVVAIAFFVLSKIIKGNKEDTTGAPITTEQPIETPTPQTTAFPLSPETMSALSTQAKSEFDFALIKAKEWRQDAVPMAVTVKYSGSIGVDNGKNTYVFFSPSLSQYYFTLNMEQKVDANGNNNFERIIYYKEDYFLPTNVSILPIKYWVTDYITALQKADTLGGKEIRSSNPKYDVNMFLFVTEGKFLNWNVEYLVDGAKKLSVPISAFTGEAVTQ